MPDDENTRRSIEFIEIEGDASTLALVPKEYESVSYTPDPDEAPPKVVKQKKVKTQPERKHISNDEIIYAMGVLKLVEMTDDSDRPLPDDHPVWQLISKLEKRGAIRLSGTFFRPKLQIFRIWMLMQPPR